MSWQRRCKFWPRLTRRLFGGLLLIAYLTTSTGFLPLPAYSAKKTGGQPFPCQDHECGCATAEDCWRHCCCFTPSERWAWARDNNVQPPEYAERPAAKSWSTARLRDQSEIHDKTHAGCSHCQSSTRQITEPSCTSCPKSQGSPPVGRVVPSKGAVLFAAWRCKGLSTSWLSTGTVLYLVAGPAYKLNNPLVDPQLPDRERSPSVVPVIPPDPPPRPV